MWLSKLKSNALRFEYKTECRWGLLWLLVVLQMVSWWFFLTAEQAELHRIRQRVAYQIEQNEKPLLVDQMRSRPAWLDTFSWLSWEYRTMADQDSWVLSGVASASDWGTVLPQVLEKENFLSLLCDWRRDVSGLWRGHLELIPSQNPAKFAFWFPSVSEVEFNSLGTVKIIGTTQIDGVWRGLLMQKSQPFSVAEGHWLPELASSVVKVSAGEVTLSSGEGKAVVLALRPEVEAFREGDGHEG